MHLKVFNEGVPYRFGPAGSGPHAHVLIMADALKILRQRLSKGFQVVEGIKDSIGRL